MTDYSFMKSGFDNLESKDETVENVGSVIMVFMENAMKNADIYVKHAKRKEITPEDIKRGLMLEVFLMKNRPNMLEQCETMKQKLKDIIRDEEENGEEVFIDGEEGTTGLQIYEKLKNHPNIDLLTINEEKRKDPSERQNLMSLSDLTFFCLPDDAASEAFELTKKIASIIHLVVS